MSTREAFVSGMIGMVLFVFAGCGGGQAVTKVDQPPSKAEKAKGDCSRVSHSEGVEPMWIQECPVHSDHVMVFCGEAHREAGYKPAYAEAYADALGKLRRFIGQKVDAKIVPDGQGGYRFQLQGVDDETVTVRGAWEGERWAEVYDCPGGQVHDCYVMLTYSRLEYEKVLRKIEQIAKQRMKNGIALFNKGKDLVAKGRYKDAIVEFGNAKKMLEKLKQKVLMPDGTASTVLADQIQNELDKTVKEYQIIGKTALVVVGLTQDGKLQTRGRNHTNAQNTIQKWVVEGGVKIRPGGLDAAQVKAILSGDREAASQAAAKKRAGMLLTVDLHCDFKTEMEGAYFSYAEGGLRLIRTDDGRELYTAELQSVKGGHVSRKGANKKALEVLLNTRVKPAVQAAVVKIQ